MSGSNPFQRSERDGYIEEMLVVLQILLEFPFSLGLRMRGRLAFP